MATYPVFLLLAKNKSIDIMRAWVYEQINNLPRVQQVNLNESDHRQILSINASALNHRDLWITKGKYPGIIPGIIMGSDACGIFENNEYLINPGLDWGNDQRFQSPTFRVLGMPDHGTFADKIIIDKSNLYQKPTHLSVFEAAALPLAGLTAYRSLIIKAHPLKNEKVLITGIGGGVALQAMQFALASKRPSLEPCRMGSAVICRLSSVRIRLTTPRRQQRPGSVWD